MKRILQLFVAITIALQANGQSLIDIYKTGTVNLVPEGGFAQGQNWSEIFPDYSTTVYGNAIGSYKSIAVAPDGSTFVGNYSSYSIQKFDANGKLTLTFGKKGNGEGDFQERPTLGGVVNGKYVFTHEHNGQIKLFTLDGKYAKTIQVDYMPLKAIALVNKISLVGHVPMGGNVRYVITIIDPESGSQNIIKKYDNLWKTPVIVVKKNNGMYSFSPSFTMSDLVIRALSNGNILVGISNQKSIEIYTPEGNLVNSFNLDYTPLAYPEDLKKEFTANLEKRVAEKKLTKEDIADVYKSDFFPKNTPFYYNILVDSDENILVFRFTEEDVDHKFMVYTYDSKGQHIAESTLNIEGYNLSLSPRFNEVAFYKGGIIGLLTKKDDSKQAASLIRFELKGK